MRGKRWGKGGGRVKNSKRRGSNHSIWATCNSKIFSKRRSGPLEPPYGGRGVVGKGGEDVARGGGGGVGEGSKGRG